MMKTFKILTIMFVSIIISNCSSPLDVPASRNVEFKDNTFENPYVKLSTNYLYYEFVHPDSTLTKKVIIQNKLSHNYLISNYSLYFGNNHFTILNKTIPIVLSAVGKNGWEFPIEIKFAGKSPGIYVDTLIFANLEYTFCMVEAKVPYIFANDYEIEQNFKLSQENEFSVNFHNLSEYSVIINGIKLDVDSKILVKTNLPIIVNRNSNKKINFIYYSDVPEEKNVYVNFVLETEANRSLVDSTSQIKIISQ